MGVIGYKMNITCLRELEERRELEFRDKVYFTIKEESLEYEVEHTYLHNTGSHNDRVFKLLDINKNELVESAYGYTPTDGGDWPFAKEDDNAALTILVRELYKIIEGTPAEQDEPSDL